MIIEEIPFFVEFVITGIILGFGYGFTKLFLNHAKDKNKIKRSEKKAQQSHNVQDEMEKYLDNLGGITQHLEGEVSNLKANGATPEQCKSLESKLELARKAQQLEPVIRLVGPKLISKVMSIIDRV